MVNNIPLIIHFDDTYFYQPRLRRLCNEIDLRGIRGIRYLCPIERLEELDSRISSFRGSLVFIGSGDFHYITYLFLKRIKDLFNLVLIDKHLDIKKTFGDFISCGSWVNEALKLKNLKEILYIGSQEGDEFWRLKSLTRERTPIYISIDKDILDPSSLETNWDHGNLTVSYLLDIISSIPKEIIIGADICGEPRLEPFSSNIERSEEINLKILNALTALEDREISA
ncbi:MAG: hypothetical protein ACP5RW_07970 [bacterium]